MQNSTRLLAWLDHHIKPYVIQFYDLLENTHAADEGGYFKKVFGGEGSGLGLSMVQGFAGQSGGAVQIASSLGEGTHVTLWLPCAEGRSTETVS